MAYEEEVQSMEDRERQFEEEMDKRQRAEWEERQGSEPQWLREIEERLKHWRKEWGQYAGDAVSRDAQAAIDKLIAGYKAMREQRDVAYERAAEVVDENVFAEHIADSIRALKEK